MSRNRDLTDSAAMYAMLQASRKRPETPQLGGWEADNESKPRDLTESAQWAALLQNSRRKTNNE